MTFQVRKWTYFCVFFLIGVVLLFVFHHWLSDRVLAFHLEYDPPLIQKRNVLENTALTFTIFPLEIDFFSSSKKSTHISKALTEKISSFFASTHRILPLITKLNDKKVQDSLTISEGEYKFWQEVLAQSKELKDHGYQGANKDFCNASTISLTHCFGLLSGEISLQREETGIFAIPSYSILKMGAKKIDTQDIEIFLDLLFIQSVSRTLKGLATKQFVIHIPRFVLLQREITSADDWAIQWGNSPKNLYYIGNELVYISSPHTDPQNFIKQSWNFEEENFPVDFLEKFYGATSLKEKKTV